jgi:hypothetical protein
MSRDFSLLPQIYRHEEIVGDVIKTGWGLCWDVGNFHVEVDLFDDKTMEWFWKRRDTDEYGGSDGEDPVSASGLSSPEFCKMMEELADNIDKKVK